MGGVRHRWTGAVVAGGLLTRGNSNTESLNVSVEASRRGDYDRISANAGYIYSRQADPDGPGKTTTADNWFAAGKYDYFFTEKLYGFAAVRVEHDTIADLDLRLTPSVGVEFAEVYQARQVLQIVHQRHRLVELLVHVVERARDHGTDAYPFGPCVRRPPP